MDPPDLERLRSGHDSPEWDRAIDWLRPAVEPVVKAKLGGRFQSEVEDVVAEALGVVVFKVSGVKDIHGLKRLAVVVARNKAIDFLRARLAPSQGGGKVVSLDQVQAENPEAIDCQMMEPALIPLDAGEMAAALRDLMDELGAEEKALMSDFHIKKLSYSELVQLSGKPIGTIGVVLHRSLEKLKKTIARYPKLMKELKEYLR